MYNIGHFIVTYTGTSWLAAQFQTTETHATYVYSWARTIDDGITESNIYRQFTPHFGKTFSARRLSLGVALLKERLFNGMTNDIAAAIKTDNIHLIHAHFGRAGYYALPIVQRTGIPLVTSFYGYDVSEYPSKYPVWTEYYQRLFAQAGQILCLGKVMRNNIIALGCPPEKAKIHHLGVDLRNIHYRSRRWLPGEPFRVLIAAAFRERKGIPYALDALGRFQQEVPLELTLIGDAPDHPDGPREKKRIMASLEKNKLLPVTTLMGQQPYSVLLEQAYKHHIFLAPSITASDGDMEGTPMVLVDVAATGMPIISTTHSDIPEIIKHGETGLLAPERDAVGILEHLRWYVSHPDQWEAMTKVGRQYIEEEFDQIKQNERLGQLYQASISPFEAEYIKSQTEG